MSRQGGMLQKKKKEADTVDNIKDLAKIVLTMTAAEGNVAWLVA